MGTPEKIVAEIGRVYRIVRSCGADGPLFTLEAFYDPYWYQCQKWDDPGHVADLLVRYGTAADHQSAFEMLKA